MRIAASVSVAVAMLFAAARCSRPPASPSVDVQGKLVEADCMAPDDSGAVQQALASDAAPAWLTCLAAGGTIGGCGAPCE